ncbi:MAG: oligosaccharide flippase family protein [Oscillospiraceae bacterium]|nr:oligosaccharide flippase family protein [Oscillospiraceae bacterium]
MPSIKKNFLYQSFYQLLLILVPLFLAPYLSRVLGAENIGINSYTFSIVTYFVYFARLGLVHHGTRTIAAVRDDKEKLSRTFSDLFALHLVISLFVLIAYIAFLVFFAGEYRLLFIIRTTAIIGAMFDINWLFLGLERVKLAVVRSTAVKLLAVGCVFIFVKEPSDLWKYILIMSLGTFGGQVIVWAFLRRFTRLVRPAWSGMKLHIKPLLILFIPVIAMSVYNLLDKIMLGAISGQIQLGFYENSQKIILVPVGLITAFNAIMLPRMANLTANSGEKEKSRLTLLSMKYVMLLAVAMTFGIAGIADRFAPWFFGGEFRECGVLIRALCVIIPFLAFQNVITAQFLLPNKLDKIHTASAIAAAVVSVSANLILIPQFGAMGAVVGMISAECLRCLIVIFAAKKQLPIGVYLKNSLFFFGAGAVMYALVRYVGIAANDIYATILIQVVVGAGFYLGACAVYLHLTKDAFFTENLNKYLKRRTKNDI